MGGGIPHGAVGASVGVLIYSFIGVTLSILLFCLLWTYGERGTYVSLLAFFSALSTVASIIEQFHYAVDWEEIAKAEYEQAIEILKLPAIGVGRAAQITDKVLGRIEFFCYNALSLTTLFWATTLFCGIWGIQAKWLGTFRSKVSFASKVFIVLWSAVVIALQSVTAVQRIPALFYLITYSTMGVSMTFGSVLLILTLYKYMKSRRLTVGTGRRGGWWASNSTRRSGSQTLSSDRNRAAGLSSESTAVKSIYDRALIARFSIGFVILTILQVCIIVYSIFNSRNKKLIVLNGVDHSVKHTISYIIFFIPGASVSLLTFLVFGTSKSWRQYRDMVLGGCGLKKVIKRRRDVAQDEERLTGFEFERLASLSKGNASETVKSEGVETRVKAVYPSPLRTAVVRSPGPGERFDTRISDEIRHKQPQDSSTRLEGGIRIQRTVSIERSEWQSNQIDDKIADDSSGSSSEERAGRQWLGRVATLKGLGTRKQSPDSSNTPT